MGQLEGIRDYLEERSRVIESTEKQLNSLQEKFESFYAQITRAREHELDQLVSQTLENRESLPDWYLETIKEAAPLVEKEITGRRKKLVSRRNYRRHKAAGLRKESIEAEAQAALESEENDLLEKNLSRRISGIESGIEELSREILSLSRGLGFFINVFKARPVDRRRRDLDAKRRRMAAELESLRSHWRDHLLELESDDEKRRQKWIEAENEAAALSARIEALDMERPRILARTVVEKVLGTRQEEYREPSSGDPPCQRCGMPNLPESSFCHICALRLKTDRTDFMGSLVEIGELNRHHRRFTEGMKACQEILGLVVGIGSGLEALLKSVRKMIIVRDEHDLGSLELEVPEESRGYGLIFDDIAASVREEQSLHPSVFAEKIRGLIAQRLSEDHLKAYFEGIGKVLSKAAAAKWD